MDNLSDLIQEIEALRQENVKLQNSREYRIGLKVSRALSDIRKLHFASAVRREVKYRKIARYGVKNNIPEDNFVYGEFPQEHIKIVVYTCITGGYDKLLDPLYKHLDITYVAFTDNDTVRSDVWNVQMIPEQIEKLDNNIMMNRYMKFHPHELFQGYDYALYIDGNVLVVSDVRNMVNRMNPSTGLAFHRHSSRNCIYKEAEVCRLEKRGDYKKIRAQLNGYKRLGFPENFGLYEANIILSDLKNPEGKRIMNLWWDEFRHSGSFRDQIALPYTVWKSGHSFDDIGNLGFNMHLNPKFKKVMHN